MKTKAEQLEELKATAIKLQQQIAELEKPKQWEPRGGSYWVRIPTIVNACKFGVERQTKKAVEKASDAMRTHNRLLAYVDEFGGDWEADWENSEQLKYSVIYSDISKRWNPDFSQRDCTSGAAYMSQDCAAKLAAKLNSGEVTL